MAILDVEVMGVLTQKGQFWYTVRQLATLKKKKKPNHVLDVAQVKWKKEGTKHQYKALGQKSGKAR